jgi:hypothetical protein
LRASAHPRVEVRNIERAGVGENIEIEFLRLGAERGIKNRAIDAAGLERRQPLGFIADLKNRRVFWIDADFLKQNFLSSVMAI